MRKYLNNVKEYEEDFERQNKVPVNEIKEALVV